MCASPAHLLFRWHHHARGPQVLERQQQVWLKLHHPVNYVDVCGVTAGRLSARLGEAVTPLTSCDTACAVRCQAIKVQPDQILPVAASTGAHSGLGR